jgi:hypothetical protein
MTGKLGVRLAVMQELLDGKVAVERAKQIFCHSS